MARIEVVERETSTVMQAEAIDGGYVVYTMDGEKYKKLKDSTFKKYFKVTGSVAKAVKAEPVSDEKKAQMIEKIKKVLKLAQDNPSMEEGLAAALQAQKLMAKYNIHEEDVTLEEIKDEITSVFSTQKHDSSFHSWRKALSLIVARNFRCKSYMQNGDIVFRGYTEDAKLALDVYMMLYTTGDKLGSKAYNDQRLATGSGKGVYTSFSTGFVKGVELGLDEQCTALMIIVPKQVEEEYTQFSAGFNTQKTSLKATNAKAYTDGLVEGKAAVKARRISKGKN